MLGVSISGLRGKEGRLVVSCGERCATIGTIAGAVGVAVARLYLYVIAAIQALITAR